MSLGALTVIAGAMGMAQDPALQGTEVRPGTAQEEAQLVPMRVLWRVPRTWPGAVAGAEMIAVVRIVDRDYEIRVNESGREYVVTRYTAEVRELLKGEPVRRRDRLEIARQGGVMTEDGAVVKYYDPKFPDYVIGDEYVVFLLWNPATDGYAPYAGPVLTYRLDWTSQRVICPADVLAPDEGDTPLTFLTFLRGLLRDAARVPIAVEDLRSPAGAGRWQSLLPDRRLARGRS